MKHKSFNFFLLVLFLWGASSLMVVVGCTDTVQHIIQPAAQPMNAMARVNSMRADYTATLKFFADARALGKVDDAQFAKIEVVRKQAATALNALEASAMAGGPPTQALIDQAQAAVDAFIAAKVGVH